MTKSEPKIKPDGSSLSFCSVVVFGLFQFIQLQLPLTLFLLLLRQNALLFLLLHSLFLLLQMEQPLLQLNKGHLSQ